MYVQHLTLFARAALKIGTGDRGLGIGDWGVPSAVRFSSPVAQFVAWRTALKNSLYTRIKRSTDQPKKSMFLSIRVYKIFVPRGASKCMENCSINAGRR